MSYYVVLADFEGETEEELSLEAGTQVELINFGEDGWASVIDGDRVGICPNTFLKSLAEFEAEAEEEEEEEPVVPEESPSCPAWEHSVSPSSPTAAHRNEGRPLPRPVSQPIHQPVGQGVRGARGTVPRGNGRPLPNQPRGAPRGRAVVRGGRVLRGDRGRGMRGARGARGGSCRGPRPQQATSPARSAPINEPQQAPDQAASISPPNEDSETSKSPELTAEQLAQKREANQKHRKLVLAEIIQTESDYVKDIEIVARLFIRPLMEKSLITREDHAALFSNLEVLVPVNQQLLTRLQAEENPEQLPIGTLFLEMADYFKLYASYCANQPKFIATLDRLSKENSTFEQYLYDQTINPECRGLNLFSFLIKPIQRICKYPLLLRDLLKVTEKDHFDYNTLVESLGKIETVVAYVNDRKRLAENLQKILDVQDQIESTEELSLVEPSRRFVREGSINVVENGRARERNTFVFNDLIVLTKPKKSMMGNAAKDHFKAQFHLNAIKIVDMADTEDIKNACQVVPKNPTEKKFEFVFMFNTPSEKAGWVKEIKTLVREFQLKELEAAQKAKAKKDEQIALGIYEEPEEPVSESKEKEKKSSLPLLSRATHSPKSSPRGSKRTSTSKRLPPASRPSGAPRVNNNTTTAFSRPPPPTRGRVLTGRPAPPPPPSGAKGKLKSLFRSESNSSSTRKKKT